MLTALRSVRLDHFTRDGAEPVVGHHIQEIVIGLVQRDAQRVAVYCPQSGHRCVVIEMPRFFGSPGKIVQTDNLALDEIGGWRTVLRVHQTLDRVDIVLCGQFMALALERSIGSEINALLDAEDISLAAVGDLRHRLCRQRNQLCRTSDIVIRQQRLKNRFADPDRVRIARVRQIEAIVGHLERHPHHFGRIGRTRSMGGPGQKHDGNQTLFEWFPHFATSLYAVTARS